jgi:hypothetical protein
MHIALIYHGHYLNNWLRISFCENGKALVRRQDLPKEAILAKDEAINQADRRTVGVISHGWLAPGHPDPEKVRREDIKQINDWYVFWDFLSLFQQPRSSDQEESFRIGLASMHVVYGHSKWLVYRLLTVPADSQNATPYLRRGWCFFESGVSIVGCNILLTILDGKDVTKTQKSPVPLSPARFAENVEALHFTSQRTDTDVVITLFDRIFPKLAEHEKLIFYAWEDDEVREFIDVLPQLTGVKKVYIQNHSVGCTAKVTADMQEKLKAALAARGGDFVYYE